MPQKKGTTHNETVGYIKPREINEEMKESYIDYAMSVIVSRALPDVRDGLKPVHRRILHTMNESGLFYNTKFRKSATVVGECFVKDTLILTNNGLVPIQEIRAGDKVYTQKGLCEVTQPYEMPKKPLLNVVLDNGISNVVTPSQKFKVLTEGWKFIWKEAKHLTKDDYLVLRAEYPEIKKLVKLHRVEKNQPLYLNKNIAYLLGIFLADGSISNDYSKKKLPRIAFCLGDEPGIAERIVSIFKREFGYTPTIETQHYRYQNKDGKIFYNKKYHIRINRKLINEFFVSNFPLRGVNASSKKIPHQIFQSPTEVIFSLVSGIIDGDGHIHRRRPCINCASVSEGLIGQLLLLLHHQGFTASKYALRPSQTHFIGEQKVKARHNPYCLEVRGSAAVKLGSLLTLASRKKKLQVEDYIKNEKPRRDCGFQYDIIPYAGEVVFGELSQNHLGSGWYQDREGMKFRAGIRHKAGCKIRYSFDLWEKPLRKTQVIDWGIKNKLGRIGSPLFEFLEHIIQNNIYFLKVSSIEKVKAQKTYDFQVEGEHEFIANGVVSHNCLGRYHPHGDVAVYDSLVRMAQDFSLRYPLVKGQGNFGSLDGDPASAMRYSEVKMSKIGQEMLKDINKGTVDFIDNYDATRKEPTVLPSPLPQLLLNGSLGIAVGMATNIPPHNLSEVCEAAIYLIDKPKATTEDLFQFIKGPDFPTGGIIYNQKEIISVYSQGRGPILAKGKAEIVEKKSGTWDIVISEIPYQVNKATLVGKIAKLIQEKKIQGVKDARDESDRDGLRIVLELKKDAFPQKILNNLYKSTDLQKKFHLNMLALVDGIQPKTLSLPEVLNYYLDHRKEVILRRSKYNLARAKEREHILEGLTKCLANIDKVIETIKKSQNREEAKKNLKTKFKLSDIQAEAILETKLSALARLERKKIEEELKEVREKIKGLTAIVKSPVKIKAVVKKELKEAKEEFGDERRTKVYVKKAEEISEKDLVPEEEVLITLTDKGYIKRISPSAYKTQKRGGKGIAGIKTQEEDFVEHFLLANTLDKLLFFTDSGKVFSLPAYEVPQGTRISKGRALVNFLEISPEDRILAVLPLGKKDAETKIQYLVMATKNGIIKKTALEDFANIRNSGLIAIRLKKGDLLRSVRKTSGKSEIILMTKKAQSIRFKEKEIRPMQRSAAGNKGVRLKKDDELIGMEVIEKEQAKDYLLVISEQGYGKRTKLTNYRLQSRGGAGIKTAKLTPRTGELVRANILKGDEELIIISKKGQVIRTDAKHISVLGRATQGVRIMKLDNDDKVISLITLENGNLS